MYLIINESNECYVTKEVGDDEKRAVDDGILMVIDMENKTEYIGGKWESLPIWGD